MTQDKHWLFGRARVYFNGIGDGEASHPYGYRLKRVLNSLRGTSGKVWFAKCWTRESLR